MFTLLFGDHTTHNINPNKNTDPQMVRFLQDGQQNEATYLRDQNLERFVNNTLHTYENEINKLDTGISSLEYQNRVKADPNISSKINQLLQLKSHVEKEMEKIKKLKTPEEKYKSIVELNKYVDQTLNQDNNANNINQSARDILGNLGLLGTKVVNDALNSLGLGSNSSNSDNVTGIGTLFEKLWQKGKSFFTIPLSISEQIRKLFGGHSGILR
jgi:hypothetical protein